jgi:TPR repeat protein
MYANGRGVQKDEQQTVYWYAKAAEQGDARAQDDLGSMYANGVTLPVRPTLTLISSNTVVTSSGGYL